MEKVIPQRWMNDERQEPLLIMWLRELELFSALYIARFMVWRELRREEKEMRKHFYRQ